LYSFIFIQREDNNLYSKGNVKVDKITKNVQFLIHTHIQNTAEINHLNELHKSFEVMDVSVCSNDYNFCRSNNINAKIVFNIFEIPRNHGWFLQLII